MQAYRKSLRDKRNVQKDFYNLASRLSHDCERWYETTNIPGLYIKLLASKIQVRFTVLREDVKRPQQVRILWDSSWKKEDEYDLKNMFWKIGIEVYSLPIIEKEIEDNLTVLIQPKGDRATRMHVSPMKQDYQNILDYAESANKTRDFDIFRRPIPKHILGTEDEDDQSTVKMKKEEAE